MCAAWGECVAKHCDGNSSVTGVGITGPSRPCQLPTKYFHPEALSVFSLVKSEKSPDKRMVTVLLQGRD